jgi:hypothetical protein
MFLARMEDYTQFLMKWKCEVLKNIYVIYNRVRVEYVFFIMLWARFRKVISFQ